MIDRDFIRRMRAKYGDPLGDDRFATLRPGKDGSAANLVERFLADASVRLAVFHSRRMGRDFVLARDANALEALSGAQRRLPVLTFSDCEKLGVLELGAQRVLLDLRQEFGPAVSVTVEARLG